MPDESIKSQVIDLLETSRVVHQRFVDSLSDADRSAVATGDQWSVKDMVSHVVFWLECQEQRLSAILRGETPPAFDNVDEVNNDNFQAHRNDSWAQVTERIRHAFDELIAQTRRFSDSELSDVQRYTGQQNALYRSIVGNGYSHPLAHFAEHYVRKGDLAQAMQIQEQVAEKMGQIAGGKDRPVAIYNLACFYAISNQPDKALALLPDALRQEPGLVEWSKQDPDLVSLHSLPAYQALYTA